MSVVVGVGVIIVNQKGEVLCGKRCGKHAPYWSIFGGHLEAGETFEQCAIREIKEETGVAISAPKIIGISNNLETYQQEGKHTVSICMIANYQGGTPQCREPDKCAELRWCMPDNLPEPHFEASRNAITLWQNKQFY